MSELDLLRKIDGLEHRLMALETLEQPFQLIAPFLALPGLVGFWLMSSVQRSTGNAYDLSGQGRTLTYNGNPTYNYTAQGAPYIDLDGAGDYLIRTDETDLDVLGTETIYAAATRGLTVGGLFWFDVLGADATCMAKFNSTGNQRSWLINKDAGDVINGYVSADGSALTAIAGPTVAVSAWYFCVLRFDPSAELAIFVNGTWARNTTAIPASVFSSTAGLEVGSRGGGTVALLNGRAACCFMCAQYLSDGIVSALFEAARGMFGL